jgi:hypothetical protein
MHAQTSVISTNLFLPWSISSDYLQSDAYGLDLVKVLKVMFQEDRHAQTS